MSVLLGTNFPMNLLEAIILGIVQGLTEFLPISSSGHLVLVGELLGIEAEAGENADEMAKAAKIMFAVAVHVGTLLSVLVYFRHRIIELIVGFFKSPVTPEQRSVLFLVLATIPAVIAGLTLKPWFEKAFHSPVFTSCMLIVTGGLLVLPILVTRLRGSEPTGEVTTKSALMMGLGQAFAILPGISRSGSTIATGMMSGVNPRQAAEFSFLMAIPAILGGAVFEFKDLEAVPEGMMTNCIVGALVAFVTGLAAVYWVLDSIRKGKFQYFAIYCAVAGIFGIVYFGFLSDSEPELPNDPVPELTQ